MGVQQKTPTITITEIAGWAKIPSGIRHCVSRVRYSAVISSNQVWWPLVYL